MHFVSTDVTQTGAATARITGNLTLHGVTKVIVLDATFNADGSNLADAAPTFAFTGKGVVKRSDFGLRKFIPIVSDETTIEISAVFEKQ
jgi:polyisoprenoid-binding protein YceI